MTSRERVKAAVERRPADRVPYFITMCGDAWEAASKRLGGNVSKEAFLDNDVEWVGVPWWNWHELEADWRGPDAPTSIARVMGSGSYGVRENVRDARQKSDKYFLVPVYGSHFEKAQAARGFENLLADMAGHPKFAKKLLNRIIEKNLVMLENFLAIPEIDGVLLGSDWGSQIDLLISPDAWDEMIRPGEQAEYDLIHSYGKDVWIHSCGKIDKVIPRLVEMGVDVLNPVQPECMDIRQLVEKHGRDLTFWGGISTQDTLPFGTPDEVKSEARRVKALMSQHNGYVLSPAQDLQADVPFENLQALLEVARET